MCFVNIYISIQFISHSKRTKSSKELKLCVQWIKDNNNNEIVTYIQDSIYTSYIDMWCLWGKNKNTK